MWKFDQRHTVGFTVPADSNVIWQQFLFSDTGHFTDQSYYQFMITGEPQYADHLKAFANWPLIAQFGGAPTSPLIDDTHFTFSANGQSRNMMIGGVSYYGLTNFMSGAGRVSAWATRCVAGAAALVPDADPAKQYFVDLNNVNWAATKAFVARIPKWGQDRGAWPTTLNTSGLWTGYEIQSTTFAAAVTENVDALAHAGYLAKWPAYIANAFGAFHISHYGAYIKKNWPIDDPMSSSGGLMTDDSLWGIQCGYINWDSATNRFTMRYHGPIGSYEIANEQRMSFFPGDVGGLSAPGGAEFGVPYFQVNCNLADHTFQLATDPTFPAAGKLVVLTDSYLTGSSVGKFLAEGLYNHPAKNAGASATTPSSYNQNILGGLKYARHEGVPVDQRTMEAMQAIADHAGYDFSISPQFAFSAAA
jgi:hypothetical protein